MQKPNLNMHDRNIRKENGFWSHGSRGLHFFTQNPKTLFLDPALKRGAPDLHRFCPFHSKLCSTKPKTVASLQNPAQTSKPRTPKPQNLIFGPGTEERSPRFAQILSVPYQTLHNEAQNRGQPSKPSSNLKTSNPKTPKPYFWTRH